MSKIIKRSILGILITCALVITISLLKILIFNDITVEPISKIANPEFNYSGSIQRPPVYLISYADGPEIFFKNQNSLSLSAINKGIDFIFNYRRSHINPTFYKRNIHILSQKSGAGYWLWKPHLILKTLENVPENAIVVYADSGLLLIKPLQPLLKLAETQDIIVTTQAVGEKNSPPGRKGYERS